MFENLSATKLQWFSIFNEKLTLKYSLSVLFKTHIGNK